MRFTPVSPHHDRGTLDRPPSSIIPTIRPRARAVKRPRSPQAMICRGRSCEKANEGLAAFRDLHTNACGLAMMDRAEIFSTERKGDRHGQGSDAQQQGKEETE